MIITASLNILKSLLAHQSRKAGVAAYPYTYTLSYGSLASQLGLISALSDAIPSPTPSNNQSTQSTPKQATKSRLAIRLGVELSAFSPLILLVIFICHHQRQNRGSDTHNIHAIAATIGDRNVLGQAI